MEFRIKLVKILKKLISYRVVKVPLSLKRRKKDKRPEMYIWLAVNQSESSFDQVFIHKRIISNLRNKNLQN